MELCGLFNINFFFDLIDELKFFQAVFIPLWIVMSISIIFCIGRIIWTIVHYYRNGNPQGGQQQLRRRFCQILTSPTVGHICVLLFLLIFQVNFFFISRF